MMRDICIEYCESTICDGCKYKDASDEEREKPFVILSQKNLVGLMKNKQRDAKSWD